MTKPSLTQTLQDLVTKHGVGVLLERGPLTGRLLDGQHKQEAWLMETAHEAGVVELLRNHPGGSSRRKAMRRLQSSHGLAPAAALQIVQALSLALGHAPSTSEQVKAWTYLTLRWLGALSAWFGLVFLCGVAIVLGGKLFAQYQNHAWSETQDAIPKLAVDLQQIIDKSKAEQDEIQVQISKAKREKAGEEKRQQEVKRKAEEEAKRRQQAMLPVLVALKGGCFQMGSPPNEPNRYAREQQHQVCVQPFKLGKYEVTQAQWQAVMGANPSNFTNCGGDCPVERVSFYQVHDFIAKLNQKTGQHYRLPTEAEWEYACRGGKQQTYCGSDDVDAVAWYTNNSGSTTQPVGKKQANGFGLYDLSGNVWEWTCSAYAESYNGNEKSCANDSTASRVLRGGSWLYDSGGVRSASRDWGSPDNRYDNFGGFRLAQD